MKNDLPEKPTKVKMPQVKPPKGSVILTDKYYIIKEPICGWYMTAEPIGKTQWQCDAESWDTKELAEKWLVKNGKNVSNYKIIEVEMTFREV